MRATIILMRNGGIARRKSDVADPQGTRYVGELSLSETTDQGLHRLCVVATHRYFNGAYAHQLFDARIVWIEGQRMMLTGFERVKSELGMIEYAQSWLCIFEYPAINFNAADTRKPIATV